MSVIFIMLRLRAPHYLAAFLFIFLSSQLKRQRRKRYFLALTRQTRLPTCPSTLKDQKKILLPFKNIPLSSVGAPLIHVRRRGFYMQISKGSEGNALV